MRYADEHKLNSEPLDQFVKRKGGINKSVARFTRIMSKANGECETVFRKRSLQKPI
jgi:hypothetical protein